MDLDAVRARLGRLARELLPPPALATVVGLDSAVTRWRFARQGRRPWSPGYVECRNHFIARALGDPELLRRLRRGDSLPPGYGVGFDERCVEYGWALAALPPGPARVLDAGSSLNHGFVLDQPQLRSKALDILTLAPESTCFWERGISYLYRDLRAIPVRDDYYDVAVCISTLEHVGCDNAELAGPAWAGEDRPTDYLEAIRELRRVLRPGGVLLLTVPFGRYQHLRTFQQFDQPMLDRAVAAFAPTAEREATFFRYSRDGWAVSSAAACAECEYVSWLTRPRARWPRPLPVEPDLAAAARAVACVRLVKGPDARPRP